MDTKSFFKILNKYKWVVILVVFTTVAVTYFFVQNLPKQYKSNVEISTGLLDPTKKVISNETVDFFKISQQFSSIMEKMEMKKTINILSYRLILHDLQAPQKKFKKYSDLLDSLNQQQKQEVILLYQQKLTSNSLLTLSDDYGPYKLYSIIESMDYGEEDLRKELDISHKDNSDLITVEYTSKNPELSAYVVNTLASEFIRNYSADVSNNANNSNELLDSLVKKKKAVMDEKTAQLSSFKKASGVLNLSEQASAVNAQIITYEAQQADMLSKIDQDVAAINTINSKLRSNDSDIAGSSVADNRELINLTNQLQVANSNVIGGVNVTVNRRRADSLRRLLDEKRTKNSNDNIIDPRVSRQSLVNQRNDLEVSLAKEKGSLRAIRAELSRLKGQFNSMVPYDADIQNYQNAADLATKDYAASFDAFNESKTSQNISGFRLNIEQIGLPGNPEPSKRAIYVAGSGFGSLIICMGVLLLISVTDNSINTISQLERVTQSKVLGVLSKIEGNERQIREIWNDKSGNKSFETYRTLLRSTRFEINGKMNNDRTEILGITSLLPGEGKTFVAYSLTYAFAMTGKKVLLIADELPVVESSETGLTLRQNFDTFLVKKEIVTEDLITVLNKSMVQSSLLETQTMQNLQIGFEKLRKEFDIIIIDINNLQDINIAKEWLLFTDKNIAVFEAGKTLQNGDMHLVDYLKEKPGFLGWILNKTPVQNNKIAS
jgi:polysaccharide biosynthesis transport protein